jgi:hypothetical protein
MYSFEAVTKVRLITNVSMIPEANGTCHACELRSRTVSCDIEIHDMTIQWRIDMTQSDLRLALTTHKGSDRLSLETTSIDSICSYSPPGCIPG